MLPHFFAQMKGNVQTAAVAKVVDRGCGVSCSLHRCSGLSELMLSIDFVSDKITGDYWTCIISYQR